MSQPIKTPKSVIVTLVAGIGLGIIAMGTIQSGFVVHSAFAQDGKKNLRTISGSTTESLAELHNLDSSFANLAEFVSPAVVDIRASSGRAMTPSGQRVAVRQGEGSGFVFRSDGYIITNDHVVDGADKVKVVMKDGREYDGTVLRAEDSDIAVVKIDAKDLPVLAFADSSSLRAGQLCMAVGSPFGMENSVTFGHISAFRDGGQSIASETRDRYYPDLIQTDASINMGNSGGPLVNVDGQVVGVNTAIYSPSGTSAGIGFSIPGNQAKFIANMLIEKGKVVRSRIGLQPDNLKEYEKKDKGIDGGVVVTLVQTPSPASIAGIKQGDIITEIGTTPIHSQLDLRNSMLIYAPGTTVPVQLLRDGKTMNVNVKLEAAPAPVANLPQQQMDGGQPGIPKGFDAPDMKMFKDFQKQFGDQAIPQAPDQQDVPAIKSGQARLGVHVGSTSADLRKEFNVPASVSGAVVIDVQPGSVAEKLGLKTGDVVTQLGAKPVKSAEDLTSAMGNLKWGDSTRIKFSRFGAGSVVQQDLTVTFK